MDMEGKEFIYPPSGSGFFLLPLLEPTSKEVVEGPKSWSTSVSLFFLESEDMLPDMIWNVVIEERYDGGFIKGGGRMSMTSTSSKMFPTTSVTIHGRVTKIRGS